MQKNERKHVVPTKMYADYLKDDDRINSPIRREKMRKAIAAMKARKAAGIYISIAKATYNSEVRA